MEIEYRKTGDYFVPNIEISTDNKNVKLGKYGRLRERYLREYRPGLFEHLKMTEKLIHHLVSIDNEAKKYEKLLIKQFAEIENVDEKLKKNNQIEWVQRMNLIKLQAQEIVCNEMIYK